MRVAALGLLACSDPPGTGSGSATAAATPANSSPERPVWQFGEGTTRRDLLPPALDTLAVWGEYGDGERPIAYEVDLNGDGSSDWLVRANRSLCGRAGCPTALMTMAPDGRFVDLLGGLVRTIYVTDRRTGDWPVLWVWVGGRDGGVHRMEFRDGQYRLSRTIRQPRDEGDEEVAGDDTLHALLSAAETR